MIWRLETKIRDEKNNPIWNIDIWVFIIIPIYIHIERKNWA